MSNIFTEPAQFLPIMA